MHARTKGVPFAQRLNKYIDFKQTTHLKAQLILKQGANLGILSKLI